MNGVNAVVFAVIGAGMELLPRVFPSWFPPNGADQSSARALWLGVMGFIQIGLGAGHIVRMHVVPFTMRVVSAVPAGDRDPLALPNPRAASGR